ncbi:hypothetical protein DK1_000042 [Bacillus phage DK1]|uniref:Uncharacterized protein n=1 Tax=Bacillus phage DK1 TaxID=2500808 RepID=A0A3T0IIU6_9CAUD|nr:hypothetical protein H3016_gp42 [Bacillus phage DK1]AZU99746.1 hypothetical protein DK1_000042 [Bacillus phage DK1]
MIEAIVSTKTGLNFKVKSHSEYGLLKEFKNEEEICEFYLVDGGKIVLDRENIDIIIIKENNK